MNEDGQGAAVGASPGSGALARRRLVPVTVLRASCRETLLPAIPAALARTYGVRMLQDRVAASPLLLRALQAHRPDVLLLDEPMFEELCALSLAQMQARFPAMRVLLTGEELHPGLAEQLLSHHCHGFVSASCAPEACLKAVRAVTRGELWLPRALLSRAVSHLVQAGVSGAAEVPGMQAEVGGALTGRETQIVEFLRQGLTNKEIARQLGIMEDTVKKHLQGVFGKLGVRRRTLVALNRAPRQPHVA